MPLNKVMDNLTKFFHFGKDNLLMGNTTNQQQQSNQHSAAQPVSPAAVQQPAAPYQTQPQMSYAPQQPMQQMPMMGQNMGQPVRQPMQTMQGMPSMQTMQQPAAPMGRSPMNPAQPQQQTMGAKQTPANVVPFPGSAGVPAANHGVYVVNVSNVATCQQAMNRLMQGHLVMVIIDSVPEYDKIRSLVDMLTGASFALGGGLHRLSPKAGFYFLVPANTTIFTDGPLSGAEARDGGISSAMTPPQIPNIYQQELVQQAGMNQSSHAQAAPEQAYPTYPAYRVSEQQQQQPGYQTPYQQPDYSHPQQPASGYPMYQSM